ncbi:NADP-dependent oxidoreductase [Nakamurella deserti]|uniref:NADP-dependent oxidoreductase n=1 Tax=Nakamurella deserti TaxID=2164074 RepID=UPI000DBEA8B5|nr:NADP-dependent oxidoreductase [Nakamurella deserti]
MRAVRFDEYGGPEVLVVEDVPEPHPGPGRIRVAVRAAGVNRVDSKYRAGIMTVKSLPYIPGTDVSGVVDEIGDGVTGVTVGDEVFGATPKGGYAEFAVLTAWAAKPASMSWVEAAAVPLAAETAARAFAVVDVPDGVTVVVNGASGGVGSAAVQLGVARGMTVVGVAGPANHAYLRELGALPVGYGDGLVGRVRELVPAGVAAALDIAGSGVLPELIALTGDPATVVSVADFSAPEHGAKATGGAEGRRWDVLPVVADLHRRGRFRVSVQQVFPLAEAAAAQAISELGHVRGKLVLEI